MLPHFEVIEVDRCFYLTFEVDNLIKNQTDRQVDGENTHTKFLQEVYIT